MAEGDRVPVLAELAEVCGARFARSGTPGAPPSTVDIMVDLSRVAGRRLAVRHTLLALPLPGE